MVNHRVATNSHKFVLRLMGIRKQSANSNPLLFFLATFTSFLRHRNLLPIIPSKYALKARVQKVGSPGCPSMTEEGTGGKPTEVAPCGSLLPYLKTHPSLWLRIRNFPFCGTCTRHWPTFFKPSGISLSLKESEIELFQIRVPQVEFFQRMCFCSFHLLSHLVSNQLR